MKGPIAAHWWPIEAWSTAKKRHGTLEHEIVIMKWKEHLKENLTFAKAFVHHKDTFLEILSKFEAVGQKHPRRTLSILENVSETEARLFQYAASIANPEGIRF